MIYLSLSKDSVHVLFFAQSSMERTNSSFPAVSTVPDQHQLALDKSPFRGGRLAASEALACTRSNGRLHTGTRSIRVCTAVCLFKSCACPC